MNKSENIYKAASLLLMSESKYFTGDFAGSYELLNQASAIVYTITETDLYQDEICLILSKKEQLKENLLKRINPGLDPNHSELPSYLTPQMIMLKAYVVTGNIKAAKSGITEFLEKIPKQFQHHPEIQELIYQINIMSESDTKNQL